MLPSLVRQSLEWSSLVHDTFSTKQKHCFQTCGLITQIHIKTDSASSVEAKKPKKTLFYFFFSSVHFTFRTPPFENQNTYTNTQVYIHVYVHVKKYATFTTPFPFKMLVTPFCISLCWKRRRFCFLFFFLALVWQETQTDNFFMMQHMGKKDLLGTERLSMCGKIRHKWSPTYL